MLTLHGQEFTASIAAANVAAEFMGRETREGHRSRDTEGHLTRGST
jgi:hypothetical protein